jgi:diguanylate cyclase (GGDEF)-like protein
MKGRPDRLLFRIAFYVVVLAWVLLGVYILSLFKGFNYDILSYFLSREQSGIKFRALILLGPFVLTVIGYLINQKAKLLEKVLVAESELRQRTVELAKINDLLSKENIDRKRAEERLAHGAFYDALTSLPNRALFIDHLRNSLARKKRYEDYAFAVLFIDVDRFKIINDSVGHLVGDQLLIMLAGRIRKHTRASDTVARLGGDEFAVLLDDIKGSPYAESFSDRLLEEMRTPFSVSGHEIFITVSIGIVLSNLDDYGRPEELLRDADTAMYHAKARGKACYATFDSTMHAEATMTLRLETDMRKAMQRNEFRVHYQPIVSLEDNKVIGFEALLRWQHPELGMLCPADFLMVAEDTGLIVPLGEWEVREACRRMSLWQRQWPACRGLAISVNVSGKMFFKAAFYDLIENTLNETGLDPHCLRLEITERMLMNHPEEASALIKRLKNLNVWFDVDDFGTGYSALNYLRHFPIRGLKIDVSLINALTSDKRNAEIVKTIILLAHTLDLDVIAEGIETLEQLEVFKSVKGKHAQGFYLFTPMDDKSAEDFLQTNFVV